MNANRFPSMIREKMKEIVFGATALVLFWSCSDLGQESNDDHVNDTDSVSFSADIQPIFNNNCAFTGCHVSGHVTGLNLTEGNSYSLLVDVTSHGYAPTLRVEPFEADSSVLWNKVAGTDLFGDRMPLGGTPLSEDEIGLIRTWIEEGALDN